MARKTPIRHDVIVAAFAEKLRRARRSRGMTQRDLARASQLTESYISRLENGAIAPGIDLVARLARALGSPIGDLLPAAEKPEDDARAVATEQAKRLFESVLRSPDPSFVFLLVQILALLAEGVERQR
jgi:transcriptional regulator with XRE-family HTH domain